MRIKSDIRARNAGAAAAVLFSLFSAMLFAVSAAPVHAATAVAGDLAGEIKTINTDVKKKKAELERLNRQADEFRNAIMSKKTESVTLEEQIGLIENRAAKTQLDIEIAKGDIRSVELQITSIDGNIADQEVRIAHERALLGSLARKLYREQFNKSTLDVLLTKRSLSEFFDAIRQIAELQDGVTKTLRTVQELRGQLAAERADREAKMIALAESKNALEVSKRQLEDEVALKSAILEETRNSELEFRYMLADLKREQSDADSEISYLEKTLRDKMDLADRLKDANTVLSWPVVPARGISTRFHDPEYPFRYVYEHPGLDIRAYQGTPVRASAAAVVARAKDSGMGYSYVMLIHSNGVSTVYGHLSRIVAREDSFVERGEIIGYSGGMPGTPGAGTMTTGPHLHFESRLKGIPVDPMRYLASLN